VSAIGWDALDLDAGTLAVRGTTIRIWHKGMFVKPSPKTPAGERILELPNWLTRMRVIRSKTPRRVIDHIPLTTGDFWETSPVFPSEYGHLRDPARRTPICESYLRSAGKRGSQAMSGVAPWPAS
jgi:hypothetical protein